MILVTGGTGLVGSHLLYELLKTGQKVVAVHRESSNLEVVKNVFSYYTDAPEALFKKIQWLEADITDVVSLEKAFYGVKYVYHCAALISFDADDDYQMSKANIEGTANVVNLSISNSIEKLCFVSSIAAIGKPLSGQEITEKDDWDINDSNYGYAITKHGAEMEVWRASQEGLDVVIVNPGVILGGGFWQSGSGKLFSRIYKGLAFYTTGVTGFIGVEDVVKAMITLMESQLVNERFILISENLSFKDILFGIADALNAKRPHIKTIPWMSSFYWRLEWLLKVISGKTPLLTRHAARASHRNYRYSNEKIKKEINCEFTPLQVVIEQTGKQFFKDL